MKQFFGVLVISLFLCVSCGSDDCPTCPRPPGPSGSPPVISDLECEPTAERGDGGGVLTIACPVDFVDPDEDLWWIVEKALFTDQDCGQDPMNDILLDVRDQALGQKEGTIDLNARVQTDCEAGIYQYQVSALDSEESESNKLVFWLELVEPAVP